MKKQVALPDTNYILRYLLQDDEEQFSVANALFDQVRSGKVRAVILESVLVECLCILTKHYQVPRNAVAENLLGLLAYKGITNPDRNRLMAALNLLKETALDPVDCLLAATAATETCHLYTFDKKLQKLTAIKGKP